MQLAFQLHFIEFERFNEWNALAALFFSLAAQHVAQNTSLYRLEQRSHGSRSVNDPQIRVASQALARYGSTKGGIMTLSVPTPPPFSILGSRRCCWAASFC